jgi:N-acetylglucosamine-6-phosphate deacetylase
MSSITLNGGTLVTPQETRFCSLHIKDGLISSVGEKPEQDSPSITTIDVSDCYITPGLIDLQINGGARCDFWANPTEEDVLAISEDLLKAGVTTILPTLITADLAHIKKNIEFLNSIGAGASERKALLDGKPGTMNRVRMPGFHLEGPCLSPKRPGVHPPEWIKPLSVDVLKQICDPSVSLITVAPETASSVEPLEFLRKAGITVSLGHSNATFDEANAAFAEGVKLVTHVFNALPAVHHRAPGPVTAAFLDESVTCAIICDGLHVSEAAVKLVLKIKGKARTLLVTDAAHVGTTGGGLVGSSINLSDAVRNLVKWNAASFPSAIEMATANPAQVLGLQEVVGQIAAGKVADIVAWDMSTLKIKHVFLAGRQIF